MPHIMHTLGMVNLLHQLLARLPNQLSRGYDYVVMQFADELLVPYFAVLYWVLDKYKWWVPLLTASLTGAAACMAYGSSL